MKQFVTTTILGTVLLPLASEAKEENAKQLPTVTVIDNRYDENYSSSESSNYKITGPLRNAPRSVTTVTRQLMDDQGVTKVSDALRNVPGISLAAGEGGNQGDNLMIRGFSARNDFFVDGMRDFGNYFRDPFNLESIEVVQGPSSVLFGRGSAGGVIAQNSKQAFLGSKKDATFMIGTNDTLRTTIDVNSKFDGLEHSAIRLNAMAHQNKVAERDAADYKRAAFAPSLAFGLGTDTRLNINYLHQNEDNTPDYGIPYYAGKPADVDRSNFYGFKSNDHLKTDVDITTAKFEHDIYENLTFRDQARYARYYRDVQVTEPIAASATSVTRSMKIRKSLETYLGNQADITGKFSALGTDHTLVSGVMLESEESAPTTFSATPPAAAMSEPLAVGFSVPVTFNNESKAKVETAGIYALDTIKFGKKWELALGARLDNLRTNFYQFANSGLRSTASRTDNVVSHNVGLVYKPAHNGSIYFNQGTSFNPSAESLTLTASSTTGSNNFNAKPEKNTIYEVGTKWDLFKKRLSTTFAVFRADKENARENNPFGGSSTQLNSGTQQVYGLLAQASGSINNKWKLMTGYSYMDGGIKKSVNPLLKNRPLTNVPEHSFSLFTTYRFDSELEIGGGANFVSERFAGSSATGAGTDPVTGTYRAAPSYLVFNAMAKYPLNKNVTLQLNVNNLTNEFYYDQIRGNNAVVPGDGRTALLTANIKF